MNTLGDKLRERSPAPIYLQFNPAPTPLKEASYVFYLALAQNRSLFHEWRQKRRSQGGLYCALYPETPELLFKMLNALGFWEREAPKCSLRSPAVTNPIRLVQIGDYRKNPHYAQMAGFLDRYFPSWKKAPVEMP
ncbi:hypothetical protein H6F88_32455 [Oculatella sp. FACHB-28]|uniref:hypothetical protein n=1 Tax=Cyanophyceae TaxID=3028117 RepID=UPI00168349FC|nr:MULTISPECIES: hypothetical protein [Cyanophyceae]MBD2060656.1 hypothetical protein [Oculatella sp. FACHB-28]MBD2068919.1 hypothetical protein [Leptolyngbya sp. FACHB-671]